MDNLSNYEEQIHKCSKCGLCQSVCPVYKVTGNDCTVSRGKFIMLKGIIKGDLKLNKNIDKYLDLCLKCNACKNFCPSGIEARNIFIAAKYQHLQETKKSFKTKLIKLIQSNLVFISFLKLAKFASKAYRKLKLNKIANVFYSILANFELGKKAILANEFLKNDKKSNGVKENETHTHKKSIAKIIYFKGCVNEYLNPRAKNSTEKLLSYTNSEIIPIDFECCGIPFLSDGNIEQFIKQAEINLAKIPEDFDYFLTDCASCQSAFVEYKNYIKDEKTLNKLRKINQKSQNVAQYILNNIKSIEFEEKVSFTYHKPCHLNDLKFLNDFLNKSKNVEYREMKDYDTCCGFAGTFAIKERKVSQAISKIKIEKALATNSDYILTSCPSCILGLMQGAIENNFNKIPKIANFIELISQADRIVFEQQNKNLENNIQEPKTAQR